MKEIKFRAWDGYRFYTPVMCGGNVFRSGFDFVNWTPSKDPVHQYTGLKDKNGVEICEGDIVYLDSYGRYLVEWGVVGFTTSLLEPCLELYQAMNDFDDDTSSSYEVIGNICENPEMLDELNQL